MPQNIYDDPDFFAGYSQLRRSREGLAGAPEWPALRRMLPPLEGARVLDLWCGFGAFARWAREMGAASVLGVDRSENMLARARAQTRDPGVTYDLADIEHLALPDASFDLVYSALTAALHRRFRGRVRDDTRPASARRSPGLFRRAPALHRPEASWVAHRP